MRTEPRLGRYILETKLGEGSHGEVWSAHLADRPEQRFALKRLRAGDREAARRLEHEARHLASLGQTPHDSLPRFHEAFPSPEEPGTFALVMELIQGQTLQRVLGKLDLAQRDLVLRALASVLAHLHGRGIVHRDLKPDNVLVTEGFWSNPEPAAIKLVDFGIAFSSQRTRITDLGAPIGAVRYLAPEILVGPPRWALYNASPDGPTRDIFAFGVIGWMLLSGRHPAGIERCETPEQQENLRQSYLGAAQQKQLESWTCGEVSPPWRAVLLRCLSLDPTHRPADGQRLLELLASAPAEQAPPAIFSDPTNPIPRGSVVATTPAPPSSAALSPLPGSISAVRAYSGSFSLPLPEPPSVAPLLNPGSSSGTETTGSSLPTQTALPGGSLIPSPPSSVHGRARARSRSGFLIGGGVLGLVGLVGSLVLVWDEGVPKTIASVSSRLAPTTAATGRGPAVSGKPAPVPLPPAIQRTPTTCEPDCCSPACCNLSQGRCLPGARCAPRSCGSQFVGNERWVLRPLGGRRRFQEWAGVWPGGSVCLSKAMGPQQCWSFDRLNHLPPGEGLAVTTDDIVRYGLDVSIRGAGGGVIFAWKNQRRSNGIGPGVLRTNLKFNLEKNTGDVGDEVAFAMDEAP